MKILGTISGSSLDGLDLALCQFYQDSDVLSWSLIAGATTDFPAPLRDRLAQATQMTSRELLKLDTDFAKFSAMAIGDFINQNHNSADYIASHGHTIFHYPHEGYSLQIGNGGTIAALSQIPTICDFRMNDVALGGQGAPIAPIVEKLLFKGHRFYLNLGGIANVSIHDEETGVISFDVCPCNQILNAESTRLGLSYDPAGINASKGTIHRVIIDRWNAMDYFKMDPPKSLDNSWVMHEFYALLLKARLSPQDALATMVEFVAEQLAQVITNDMKNVEGDRSLFASGGGAHNDFLMSTLQDKLKDCGVKVHKPASEIIDFKEAILMSLMGYLRVKRQPNCLPSVTGASRATVGGAIYVP